MSTHEDLTKFTPGNEVAEAQKDAQIAALTARVADLEAEIRQLGEIGDVCTYSTLKTICTGRRCKRRPPADGEK
jgi:hypothetical protein